MTAVSAESLASARKILPPDLQSRANRIESELIRRLSSVGQAAVAELCGVDESTVSRLKGDAKFGLRQFAIAMAALGLKVVPLEMKCYRPEEIDPYIQLAQQHMRRVRSVHDLSDDDPE